MPELCQTDKYNIKYTKKKEKERKIKKDLYEKYALKKNLYRHTVSQILQKFLEKIHQFFLDCTAGH